MDEDLKNLTKLPWASIPELAGFRYVNRTTVSRKEGVWNREWTGRSQVRWPSGTDAAQVVEHHGRADRGLSSAACSPGARS